MRMNPNANPKRIKLWKLWRLYTMINIDKDTPQDVLREFAEMEIRNAEREFLFAKHDIDFEPLYLVEDDIEHIKKALFCAKAFVRFMK